MNGGPCKVNRALSVRETDGASNGRNAFNCTGSPYGVIVGVSADLLRDGQNTLATKKLTRAFCFFFRINAPKLTLTLTLTLINCVRINSWLV